MQVDTVLVDTILVCRTIHIDAKRPTIRTIGTSTLAAILITILDANGLGAGQIAEYVEYCQAFNDRKLVCSEHRVRQSEGQ